MTSILSFVQQWLAAADSHNLGCRQVRSQRKFGAAFLPGLLLWLGAAVPADAQPTILAPPHNAYATIGGPVTFSAVVTGQISNQWRFNGTPIPGATNIAYTNNTVVFTNAGNYDLVVGSASAARTSSVAVLSVGNLAGWGVNTHAEYASPVTITNTIAAAGANAYSLVLLADGTVRGWGLSNGVSVLGQTNPPPGLANVVQISAGDTHALALKQDGTVVAWGSNSNGQTNVPPSLTNAIAIAAGLKFSVALSPDGTPVAWGLNDNNQTSVPAGLTGVVAVACGGNSPTTHSYTLALRADGTAAVWGGVDAPTGVPASATNLVAIAAGGSHCLALRADGSVIGWGLNSSGQTTIPDSATNIVAIAAGKTHSLAVRQDGIVIAWGGDTSGDTVVPVWLTNVSVVAAGPTHSLAVTGPVPPVLSFLQPADRVVKAGTTTTFISGAVSLQPLTFQWRFNGTNLPDATNATLVIASAQRANIGTYTVVVSNGGQPLVSRGATLGVIPFRTVLEWGDNGSGQALPPAGLVDPQFLTGGYLHSLAVRSDGSVLGWGDYGGGQGVKPVFPPIVRAIAAGYDHNLVLFTNNQVQLWTWGSDNLINFAGPSGAAVTAIAAGYEASLALLNNGTVWAWGDPMSVWSHGYPLKVPSGLSGVAAVAIGLEHALALKSDGTVVVWGSNLYGATNLPPNATNVTAIAAGNNHSLALRADGTLVAWGDNTFGQTNLPPGLTNVTAIACGAFHNLALRSDGTVVAWGENNLGQATVPAGLTNVTAIAAGGYHSLAVVDASPPCIALLPAGRTTPPGTTTTFQSVVSGTPPIALQWQVRGTNIPDATNYSLTLSNLLPAQAGDYFLLASNEYCIVTSAPATLTIGAVIGWGSNWFQQIEIPAGVTNPVAIAAGRDHSLILQGDGSVVTTGDNTYGQRSVPAALTNAVAVSANETFSLGLAADGTVFGWGQDAFGQTNIPPGLSGVTAISAGDNFGLALRGDGTVSAWGGASIGNSGQTNVPAGLSNIVAVAASSSPFQANYSLALTAQGTIVGWGTGPFTPPAGLSNVVALAAANSAVYALKNDGTLVAWGADNYGMLSSVTGLSNVAAISACLFDGLALHNDGTILGWGQEGTNTPAGLADVRMISVGDAFKLAITGDGSPFVTVQPFQQMVAAGGPASLSVMAVGRQPLGFQWFCNNQSITNATNSILTLGLLALTNGGVFHCVVSNSLNATTSSNAALTVVRGPIGFDTSPGSLQLGDDGFQFTLTGLSGHGPSVVYASDDLVTWQAVATNPPALGTFQFLDSSATNSPARYYKLEEQ